MKLDTDRGTTLKPPAPDENPGAQGRFQRGIALGPALPDEDLLQIERELNLRHAKWHTHVAGRSVLSPEPLLIQENEWNWLCSQAEAATEELFALEQAIARDGRLLRLAGVPRKLWSVLRKAEPDPGLRMHRFDFHPTREGWVLSEVNSDVPGGFGEAEWLPRLYRKHADGNLPPSPLEAWGKAIQARLKGGTAACLYAPGFLEDEEVARVFAGELRRRGFATHLVQSPAALRWKRGIARLRGGRVEQIDLLVRFYQVEWLAKMPWWMGWRSVVEPRNQTLVINPILCAISESKRLPLCFDHLPIEVDTLRRLLPECCEPSAISTLPKVHWVLKAAYSNTGDEVHLGSEMKPDAWSVTLRRAMRERFRWVAQRRFETIALHSTMGPVKPCVGVFVIAGRAAGAYVRLSRTQVTDGCALEAPLFILRAKEDG